MTSLAPSTSPSDATKRSPAHDARPEIALIGNPNTGKTALFNSLTGARQRVGNYPGVTVDRKEGFAQLGDKEVSFIDLPGTYSLAAISADERVVIDVLGGRVKGMKQPDVVVCVLDSTNLLRNLFLASQVADTGLPVVICLNMWDAAEQQGITVDEVKLAETLGAPIVKTVARKSKGVPELKQAILEALDQPQAMKQINWPASVIEATEQLEARFAELAKVELTRAESLRLLFDADSAIVGRLSIDPTAADKEIAAAREILRHAGFDPAQMESNERYRWLGDCVSDTVTFPPQRKATHTESIDNLLTHRFWGLITFGIIMYAVFWSIYTFAGPFMEAIEATFAWIGASVGSLLVDMPILQALVENGVIAGVGGVLVFLPQILILFFFISLLEDTGYMARAAFLMDKLFSWCGLNGKSFVPMLGSYACAIPGIMSARTIEDPKARLTTILIAPLMSCSARLPVYVIIIGAFIEPRYGGAIAAFALFFMHILGLILAIPIAWVLNRLVFKTKALPFILEMPPYRVPRWRDVLWRMYLRGREFVLRAGTVIFAMSIIIWALCYFPRSAEVEQQYIGEIAQAQNLSTEEAAQLVATADSPESLVLEGRYLENSYMGTAGKFVQPVFAPAGFDWKITVGVMSSFPAREVIIATLGIIYDLGDTDDEESTGLKGAMAASTWPETGKPVFTIPVALAVMVFFALCSQCGATVAVTAKESSWKWAVFSFTYMTVLAWVAAVATFQIGTFVLGLGA